MGEGRPARLAGGVEPSARERLRLLVTGGHVEAALDGWAAERPDPVGQWRRVYGRLRPGRSPWAVLVYQAEPGPTVQVGIFEPSHSSPGVGQGSTAPHAALGAIEITPCEEDPALPGLRAVLAALEDSAVVRYRPGHRCTVRGVVGSDVRFVKVLAEGVDDQREARARWEAAASGHLSFSVAEPFGWDEQTRASWYGAVPGGAVLPALLGDDGRQVAERIGRSLGELAVAPLRPAHTCTPADHLTRAKRALARTAAVAPALTDELRRAEDALTHAHQGLAVRPLVPVHGAAHLGQWLVDRDGRLGLVDFERWARGEPEFDLAAFLVDLETQSSMVSVEDLKKATLIGFRAVAGEPNHHRLALYDLHRRLAKVARTAAALRPDAEDRAARLLDRLQEPLATLAG